MEHKEQSNILYNASYVTKHVTRTKLHYWREKSSPFPARSCTVSMVYISSYCFVKFYIKFDHAFDRVHVL